MPSGFSLIDGSGRQPAGCGNTSFISLWPCSITFIKSVLPGHFPTFGFVIDMCQSFHTRGSSGLNGAYSGGFTYFIGYIYHYSPGHFFLLTCHSRAVIVYFFVYVRLDRAITERSTIRFFDILNYNKHRIYS